MKSSFKVHASATPNEVDRQSSKKKGLGMMMSCQEKLAASLCDLNFCFGKGDIYLFTMPAVT